MITEKILYKDDNGDPAVGLSLTITYMYRVSDNALITPLPSVSEIGNGWYKFTFDNDRNEEYIYQTDCGIVENITNRYAEGIIENISISGESISAIFAYVIDQTRTFGQFLKTLMAIMRGNSSVVKNDDITTQVFNQEDGTTPQITATIDANGNRTIVEAE